MPALIYLLRIGGRKIAALGALAGFGAPPKSNHNLAPAGLHSAGTPSFWGTRVTEPTAALKRNTIGHCSFKCSFLQAVPDKWHAFCAPRSHLPWILYTVTRVTCKLKPSDQQIHDAPLTRARVFRVIRFRCSSILVQLEETRER